MNASNKLLDKYAEVCKHRNGSEIARGLKVSPQAVNGWRHETAHPNAEAVERMCQAINEPLRAWLPLIEAERARTPADKRVWLRLAQAAATVALTLGFGGFTTPAANAQNVLSAAHNPGAMYIM